ncbi:MAG: hypothetical protein OXQ99_04290 [Chloroflexota bacterium]|nr:hypothetical protein [Chloroflexota bacterium]
MRFMGVVYHIALIDFTTERAEDFLSLAFDWIGRRGYTGGERKGENMAATADIRFKRMQAKYEVLENAQDEVFNKVDSLEAALLGLTEAVSRNTEQIEVLTNIVTENQRQITVLNEKVDRLMTHLDVPPKPPAGFLKD